MRQQTPHLIRKVDATEDRIICQILAVLAVLKRSSEGAKRAHCGGHIAPLFEVLSRVAEEDNDGEVTRDDAILNLDVHHPLTSDGFFTCTIVMVSRL